MRSDVIKKGVERSPHRALLKAIGYTDESRIEIDLALIKVAVKTTEEKTGLMQLVDIFRAKVLDITQDTYIIEVTGNEEKVGAITDLLRKFGIREMVRTGTVAMTRTQKSAFRAVRSKVNG